MLAGRVPPPAGSGVPGAREVVPACRQVLVSLLRSVVWSVCCNNAFCVFQISVRVTTMDAELEFAIQPNTTGKQLFDQVSDGAAEDLKLVQLL